MANVLQVLGISKEQISSALAALGGKLGRDELVRLLQVRVAPFAGCIAFSMSAAGLGWGEARGSSLGQGLALPLRFLSQSLAWSFVHEPGVGYHRESTTCGLVSGPGHSQRRVLRHMGRR